MVLFCFFFLQKKNVDNSQQENLNPMQCLHLVPQPLIPRTNVPGLPIPVSPVKAEKEKPEAPWDVPCTLWPRCLLPSWGLRKRGGEPASAQGSFPHGRLSLSPGSWLVLICLHPRLHLGVSNMSILKCFESPILQRLPLTVYLGG